MARLISLLALCLFLAGCRQPAQQAVDAAGFGPNEVAYAKGFSLQRKGGVVKIAVHNPWDSLHAMATYYLVADVATPVPAGGIKVKVPLRRVVPTSTTHYEPLCMLGQEASVVGICSPERTYNPTIRAAYECGKIKGLGDNFNINREVLMGLRPEALFVSRYSAADQCLAAVERDGNLLLYNQEWQENTLLGRAEWIKFMAAFYDKLDLADSLFCGMASRYNQLKVKAAGVDCKPKVMSGCGFHGTWYVPGGQSYMAGLYRDAGADYAYSADDHTGSLSLSLETVLTTFAGADYWFGAQQNTMAELLASEPRTRGLKACQGGQVYNFNRRQGPGGSTDFWEGAVSHPDWLLADVIAVLHPSVLPGHEMVYVKRLEK